MDVAAIRLMLKRIAPRQKFSNNRSGWDQRLCGSSQYVAQHGTNPGNAGVPHPSQSNFAIRQDRQIRAVSSTASPQNRLQPTVLHPD
jgi:hypothetical protein